MGKGASDDWNARRLRTRLLGWYDLNRRDLPWRQTTDPYAIWVSEIMLQQTRVAAVIERYKAFLARFPSVAALAAASEPEVLALWSGLGYYRRARMLHEAARLVVSECNCIVPVHSAQLRALPGIGAYTAAAIASIAYGERAAVVDGNVERVICRLAGWDAAGKQTAQRRRIEALAAHLLDPKNPGDFNQAMMELGATVCTPRNPQCTVCPLERECGTRGEHKTPSRAKQEIRHLAQALAARTRRGVREVLLQQRPAELTVMPGMWELPALRQADVRVDELRMELRHAIMNVNYRVRIREVEEHDVRAMTIAGGRRRWTPIRDLDSVALTGLARKVLTRARLLPETRESALSAIALNAARGLFKITG
jgi:A/G-specific adenine glycosylase